MESHQPKFALAKTEKTKMGAIHSQNDQNEEMLSDTQPVNPSEEFVDAPEPSESLNVPASEEYTENVIYEDLLIELLSYVPVKDLLTNCRLVCKQWRSLIDGQSVWRLKCEREKIRIPTCKLQQLPDHFYRNVYRYTNYKSKNMLKNPCGEREFYGWEFGTCQTTRVSQSVQRGFIIENPPAGCQPVPEEVGSQSCFATTYYKCEKYQCLNIREKPFNDYLLRHDLVKIKVGEWHAARFDCACEYELRVLVYNSDFDVLDQFEFKFEEEQWSDSKWHLVTHEFDNMKDAYFLFFHHEGKDRQFWAGHYGSKMTGGFVQLAFK